MCYFSCPYAHQSVLDDDDDDGGADGAGAGSGDGQRSRSNKRGLSSLANGMKCVR